MKWEKWRRSCALVAFATALSGAAEAVVIQSDTVLVRGPEYASTTELSLGGPGAYQITTTDLRWLDAPLDALSFGAFTTTAPIKTMLGAGTLEFFYGGEGRVFLQLYARPAAGKSAALVGVQVDNVTVVALPASLWLLLSSLMAAGFWRWLQRRALAMSNLVTAHAAAIMVPPRSAIAAPAG